MSLSDTGYVLVKTFASGGTARLIDDSKLPQRSRRSFNYALSLFNNTASKGGVLFPCVGMVNLVDSAWGCVEAIAKKGIIGTKEVKEVGLDTFAVHLGNGDLGRHIAAVGWAGHWNTVGTVDEARLGWKPVHRKEAWHDQGHFDSELDAVLRGKWPSALDKATG